MFLYFILDAADHARGRKRSTQRPSSVMNGFNYYKIKKSAY